MTPKERIEKLDQLFDHVVGLAVNFNGPEGMVKYAQSLQTIEWIIKNETELMEDEHGNG